MSANYLLSMGIGGGGGRCLLIEPETGHVTITYRPWSNSAVSEVGEWSFDLDVDHVWATLGELVKTTLERGGIRPEQVAGVSATSMRHGIVLVDKDGDALFARPNTDARAVNQSMALAGERGEALYKRTGHWPSPICPAPVLSWMQEHQPAALDAAHAVLRFRSLRRYRVCQGGNLPA